MPARSEPVASPSQAQALRAVLDRARELARPSRPAVLLFDLDDTLLSTSGRNLRALREFAARAETRARWPREGERLAALAAPRLRYAIVDSARAAGVEDEELLGRLRRYWFERFFTNEYLGEDEPLSGAPEFCALAAEAGASLVYLTGRDESMRPGTVASLKRHGFPAPDGERAHLMLKPAFDAPDLEFKGEALSRVAALGPVAGSFENEPAHANLFRARFPDGLTVLLETRHSGRPVALDPAVLRIKDFRI